MKEINVFIKKNFYIILKIYEIKKKVNYTSYFKIFKTKVFLMFFNAF